MKHCNNDVTKVINTLKNSYIDPFKLDDPPKHLVNIATGVVAKVDVEVTLTSSYSKGRKLLESFEEERLIENDSGHRKKSLYDTLPRSGIKTMATQTKSVNMKGKKMIHVFTIT